MPQSISVVFYLFIYSSIFFGILSLGYDIDPISYNLIACRYNFHASILFDGLNASYLVFASIDRILITSSNARIRQYNTPRLVSKCITSAAVF